MLLSAATAGAAPSQLFNIGGEFRCVDVGCDPMGSCNYGVGFFGDCEPFAPGGSETYCQGLDHDLDAEVWCCTSDADCVSRADGSAGRCVDLEMPDGIRICEWGEGVDFCDRMLRDLEACRDPAPVDGPVDWGHGDCDADGTRNQDEAPGEVCPPSMRVDAGVGDAGIRDAAVPDAGDRSGRDAGPAAAPPPVDGFTFDGGGGCSCDVARSPDGATTLMLVLLLASLARRLRSA